MPQQALEKHLQLSVWRKERRGEEEEVRERRVRERKEGEGGKPVCVDVEKSN